ncbi:MAG: PaaI family thioesterase [Nitrospinota bacterium]
MSRPRGDADGCFVCGPDNRLGLRVGFRLEGEVVRAHFTPAPHHQGYDGLTHGGIIASLLDDAMVSCLFLRGLRAYTAKLSLRFRRPVPTGRRLLIEAEILERRGTLASCAARAFLEDGTLAAEAESTLRVEEEGEEGER